MRDYALSEVVLRESREKRELLGLQEHLTTDQASWQALAPPRACMLGCVLLFSSSSWQQRAACCPLVCPACPGGVHPVQIIAAAEHVMSSTIRHIDGKYGSARNYMKGLGLTDSELAAIEQNLWEPGLEVPATAAAPASCSS